MNSSVSESPVNGTTENDTYAEICQGDCYLLGLLKQNRGQNKLIIVSWLLLCFLLLVFSMIIVLVTRRTARLMERASATIITNLGVTGTVIGGLLIITTLLQLTITIPFKAVVILKIVIPRSLHIVVSLTLACLTLDRYLALCHPLRYHALLTDSRCSILVALAWLLPFIILGAACIYGRTFDPCIDIWPFYMIYLTMFIAAIVAIVAMYTLIAKEFRRPLDASVNREDMIVVRRRTAKELMVVLLLNLLLAAPDIVMQIILLNCPDTLPDKYHLVPHLLLVHLLCFYPLYAWKNIDFRRATLDTFTSYRNSLRRFLGGICSVSKLSCRVSFAKLSRTSSNTASSSGVPSPPAASPAAPVSVAGLSTSTSSSSLPSAAAVTPSGEDNAVFFA